MEENPIMHLDYGELEAYRRGEADDATAEHVAGCAECRGNLEELEALAELVRESEPPLPPVPDEIEQRILWSARQNAARVRRQRARQSIQRWAIAASVLLTAGTFAVWQATRPDSLPSPALPRERDGVRASTLDIVDALALARQLAATQPAVQPAHGERDSLRQAQGERDFDVNHDGRVDNADVEGISRQAVALGDA